MAGRSDPSHLPSTSAPHFSSEDDLPGPAQDREVDGAEWMQRIYLSTPNHDIILASQNRTSSPIRSSSPSRACRPSITAQQMRDLYTDRQFRLPPPQIANVNRSDDFEFAANRLSDIRSSPPVRRSTIQPPDRQNAAKTLLDIHRGPTNAARRTPAASSDLLEKGTLVSTLTKQELEDVLSEPNLAIRAQYFVHTLFGAYIAVEHEFWQSQRGSVYLRAVGNPQESMQVQHLQFEDGESMMIIKLLDYDQ